MYYGCSTADQLVCMISTHRDGWIIARAMTYFDIDTISGSSSKGGAGAFRRAARFLRHAGVLGITPDGPRGPAMRASDGGNCVIRDADGRVVRRLRRDRRAA